MTLVRTVGLADRIWTETWLGRRDLKDKETKRGGSNVSGAIIVLDSVTVRLRRDRCSVIKLHVVSHMGAAG